MEQTSDRLRGSVSEVDVSASDIVDSGFGSPVTGELAQAGLQIGSVTNVTGTVTVVRGTGETVVLSAGDPIFQGDLVNTDAGGSVGLAFNDDSTMSLGASSSVEMDELVFDPAAQTGGGVFNVFTGVLTYVSGEIAKTDPDALTINTPVATIGIRGTTVAMKVAPGADEVRATRGESGDDVLGMGSDSSLLLGQSAESGGGATDVVLLPDADGNIGEMSVANDAGEQVFNQANTGTSLQSSNDVIQTQSFSSNFIQSNFSSALSANPGSASFTGSNDNAGEEGSDEAEGEEAQSEEEAAEEEAQGEEEGEGEEGGEEEAEAEGEEEAAAEEEGEAEGEEEAAG